MEGDVDVEVAATFLQRHPNTTFYVDRAAAADLTRVATPWLRDEVQWTPEMAVRAVVWLSEQTGRAVLKLTQRDYADHKLSSLVARYGSPGAVNGEVFNVLGAKIRGKSKLPRGRRIVVFSPHPDDDVISMGGTLIRLVAQGHKVHIAYMTSGNIAVFDHDARRFVDFVDEFVGGFGDTSDKVALGTMKKRVFDFLDKKGPGEPDSPEVLNIKGMIRATEARAAALACGIPPEQLEFMDLRFYRTGTITKNPVQPQDIEDIIKLLQRLQPAQIYVAGEMSDPHGTHRLCAEAIFESVRQLRARRQAEGASSAVTPPFDVWLYRGAWEEWEPHEIEMAVPVSPDVLERKKQAIFRHQSQKDRAMFPGGADRREFWQRAEDRNLATAKTFDLLGLPEYYAMEAFVKWKE